MLTLLTSLKYSLRDDLFTDDGLLCDDLAIFKTLLIDSGIGVFVASHAIKSVFSIMSTSFESIIGRIGSSSEVLLV